MAIIARSAIVILGVAWSVIGCSAQPPAQERGAIRIDGSSTVFPITEAVTQAYNSTNPDSVEVNVSFSGTGGGARSFALERQTSMMLLAPFPRRKLPPVMLRASAIMNSRSHLMLSPSSSIPKTSGQKISLLKN